MPRKANTKSADAVETKSVEKKVSRANEEAKPVEQIKQVYRVKNTLTPTTFVTVRNGFNGRLVYKSSRTGEKFVWEGFGAEQDMELQELKNAKSAHKAYFENNWFLFDDPEVVNYLGVDRLYAAALSFNEFDELFSKTPEEVKARVAEISNGQMPTIAYKAKQLIADGTIDSMKMINTLEECLGVELIER